MTAIAAIEGPAPVSKATEFMASIVVFLVALPLCMGIAIASGAPPALGLATGIIGGLVVGFIAGSPLQVSGPAAGMAVLVFELVTKSGLMMLGVVVLIAGAVQLAAGVLRWGQWFRAISPSVIHGMLAGIGVLILTSQFHVMFDLKPVGGGFANIMEIPASILKVIFPVDGSVHHLAAMVGVLTIVSIFAWDRFKPQVLRMIPAPLIAVIVGSVAAAIMQLPIDKVQVPASLVDSLNIPLVEAFTSITPAIVLSGFIFAFVASAETLLCATAVDQMHSGVRTDYDKELRAQGVGNLLCGAIGALPMTGVIVRSTANVQAGAVTRWSAVLHGVWLLVTVAALPWLLNNIPTAVLAAILVYTGYKLINLAQIRKITQFGRWELAIYLVTLGGVVGVDLLSGVIMGFLLATAKVVYVFSHMDVEVEEGEDDRIDLHLEGSATFFSIPKLAASLDRVKQGAEVHVHVEDLTYIDHACLDMLTAWRQRHEATGGTMKLEWETLARRYSPRSQEMPILPLGQPQNPPAEAQPSQKPTTGGANLEPAQ
ncbi:MAG: SulP family inorganic anion transporter [Pseudomonadota bacterium]